MDCHNDQREERHYECQKAQSSRARVCRRVLEGFVAEHSIVGDWHNQILRELDEKAQHPRAESEDIHEDKMNDCEYDNCETKDKDGDGHDPEVNCEGTGDIGEEKDA